MPISVVMPCLLLDQELLDQAQWAIRSLKDLNKDIQLIIVDDGSKIGSGFLKSEADIYIRNEKNIGFGAACNMGARKATGDYLALTCVDVEMLQGSFNDLITDHGLDEREAVVCPSFKNKGHKFEKEKEYRQETDGASYIFPISIYKRNGWYDEEFGLGYFEDAFLWWQLRRAGIPLLRSGSMLVNHLEGTTQKKLGNRDLLMEKNRQLYEKKTGEKFIWTG